MKRDKKFFAGNSLIFGLLALLAIGIFALAIKITFLGDGADTAETGEVQASIEDRIRPFGQVYLPGEEVHAAEPTVAEAAPAAPVVTLLSGPQVYNEACIACHGTGIGGAPMIGDVEAWDPRMAQGLDLLYTHAIEGYTGSTGYMPPKGARLDLSDQEITDAVDYMIEAL